MAASLVGGAFLSSFINVLFNRLSDPMIINMMRGKKVDRKLLQKLETILNVVEAVLNDAEKKQITDPAVKRWLENLQDVVYDADDLLYEFVTKAATQKDPGNFLSRFLNLQDREMVNRIEEIIARLQDIANHKDIIGLKKIAANNLSRRIPSTSLVKKYDIFVGRDKERYTIVKLLLDDANDGDLSVIPIVGMGGIGKTALAKLVYNDDRVQQKFHVKAWVCVGEEFDVLMNALAGKNFLVVLDDVWSSNREAWESFLSPFECGSEDGKILVTTRLDPVASMMKTKYNKAHSLSLLDDEQCWSVFASRAWDLAESRGHSALEKIGRKIVEKCNGLPLAAQTLGRLLRGKDNEKDWNDVLNSEIWEYSEEESGLLPALRISYFHLPSYLKRCFTYCSLYPKAYELDRDELMLLWMTEGLLQQPKSGNILEEVGYEYFDDLVSRSFFQHSNYDENLFVMHDLMHDLATFHFSSGEEHLFHDSIGNSFPPSLRWLSIKNCKNLEFPMQHQQHFSLEYLHIDNSCDSLTSFALLVFPNLKNLKITRLKNLTSLGDVSQSQSLQELSILGCPKLEKIRLPASLRELRLSECQLLVEGIERKDPHIWSTISHIPHIEVDGFRFHDDSAS
ncbi:Putative disease resistance RPP13-like protein [Arachis hypogaea]|nr:Putative disease resistance RPP13-like protein [Arachis hypogaea]